MLWSFCVYLESVSVLPQLRMMQKAKVVKPFIPRIPCHVTLVHPRPVTSHVSPMPCHPCCHVRWWSASRHTTSSSSRSPGWETFTLPRTLTAFIPLRPYGLPLRFFSCAHWVLQFLEGNKHLFQALGSGMWPVMVLVSEVVQTFILADFCYYYVKSYADGSGIVRLPAGIV